MTMAAAAEDVGRQSTQYRIVQIALHSACYAAMKYAHLLHSLFHTTRVPAVIINGNIFKLCANLFIKFDLAKQQNALN